MIRIASILQPYYLHRPKQIFIRLFREFFCKDVSDGLVKLPWGVLLGVNAREHIGKRIWLQGIHELEVSEVLYRLLKKGDLAIDVGANIGYTASIMAVRVGREGEVLAFEPHPMIYKVLRDNIGLFNQKEGLGKIHAFDVALGRLDGKGFLTGFEEIAGGSNWGTSYVDRSKSTGFSIQIKTLDGLAEGRHISVLKMDVEGGEMDVLEGARNLLSQQRIDHVVYEKHLGASDEIHRCLRAYGFCIFYLSHTSRGVAFQPIEMHPTMALNEAPNFVATRHPQALFEMFRRKGWRCLNSA